MARRTVALHAFHAEVERLGCMDRASDVSTTLGLCAGSRKRWQKLYGVDLHVVRIKRFTSSDIDFSDRS